MIKNDETKIRFTIFLAPSLAAKLKTMPRKKRNKFVNEHLADALERESLFSHLEAMKKKKTSFDAGIEFIRNIRKEWVPRTL